MKIKKLNQHAVTPFYATEGAACFDLHSTWSGIVGDEPYAFGTGLAFEVPENHVMLIFSRSGHGYKEGVRLSNCVGVIDSDYRGEVSVKLHRDLHGETLVKLGDRIAQAMVIPVDHMTFEEVDELSDTTRGTGGFGSTGS